MPTSLRCVHLLQCVALCCSLLQYVAVCVAVFAVCCSVRAHAYIVATCAPVAVCCSVLQCELQSQITCVHHFALRFTDIKLKPQYTATHCNTLQKKEICVQHHKTIVCSHQCNPSPTLHHTLQHTATHCNTTQRTATHCNTLQHVRARVRNTSGRVFANTYVTLHTQCNKLKHTATHTATHTVPHCNTLQHTATHCNTLQHTATHCNTGVHLCTTPQGECLQSLMSPSPHVATHCNTLQHFA